MASVLFFISIVTLAFFEVSCKPAPEPEPNCWNQPCDQNIHTSYPQQYGNLQYSGVPNNLVFQQPMMQPIQVQQPVYQQLPVVVPQPFPMPQPIPIPMQQTYGVAKPLAIPQQMATQIGFVQPKSLPQPIIQPVPLPMPQYPTNVANCG